MSVIAFWGRLGVEKEVGVPRRFSISAAFALVTIYGVLFRGLVLLGANATWTGLSCLFVGAITISQMTLFRGVRPRAASFVSGAIAAPAILLLVVLDEMFTQWFGLNPVESGFGTFGDIIPPLLFLTVFGSFVGYLVGIALAGVFYIASRIRPDTRLTQPSVQSAYDEEDSQLFQFLAHTYAYAGRILNPIPKGNPLRGALAMFEVCVVLGFLIAPFVMFLVPYQVWLIFAAVGFVLALWMGNLQLVFLWPAALAMIGFLLADSVFESMQKVPMIGIQLTGGPGQRLTWLWLTRYACLFAAISLSAVVGWTQWLVLRNTERVRFGWVAFGLTCLLLWGGSVLVANRLEAYAQTPVQQLQAKVCERGGLLLWNLDGSMYHVGIPHGFGDDEVSQILPHLSPGGSVLLAGPDITNATAARLDGKSLSTLGLNDTHVTDEGFAKVTSFSVSQLTLMHRNADLKLLANLIKDPRMPGMLQVLTVIAGDLQGENFQVLQKCKALSNVSLTQCRLTDDDMDSLVASMPISVTWLGLDANDISDIGLQKLQGLKQLKHLSIKQNSGVTADGVEAFQKANPTCIVGFTEPDE